MALSQAELLILANQYSGRAETDLTPFLRNTIHDLERDTVFLEETEEITLVDAQRNYALSALTYTYKKPFHLQPKGTSLYYDELVEIPYDEYKQRLISNSGSSRPLVFAVFDGVIYLDPPPLAATYTKLDIWGKVEHGDAVTSILYPEKYRKLLANGCAWEIFKKYGLTDSDKAKACLSEYESEKVKFTERKANEKHHTVKYNDI